MKTRILTLLITGVVVFAQSGVALAQSPGWSAVQAVPADDRLIVKQKDGKTIEGKMIEANETNLTISRNNKVVNISRDSIARVEHSRGKANKGKWALIWAGVGAGVGGLLGGTLRDPQADDSEILIPVGLALGAGIGAAGGALMGAASRKRVVIYTAP
ncbi:MAG TPA: hypothetical protein VJU86_17475 [Pyrinomonadaceae bacterium]|nr:hypothetical protein [Pyrinomonadaceae bacterium]